MHAHWRASKARSHAPQTAPGTCRHMLCRRHRRCRCRCRPWRAPCRPASARVQMRMRSAKPRAKSQLPVRDCPAPPPKRAPTLQAASSRASGSTTPLRIRVDFRVEARPKWSCLLLAGLGQMQHNRPPVCRSQALPRCAFSKENALPHNARGACRRGAPAQHRRRRRLGLHVPRPATDARRAVGGAARRTEGLQAAASSPRGTVHTAGGAPPLTS